MAKSTFKTNHDLPAKTREEMVALLNEELAGVFDLYSQTKQAHWNVKGMEFFQLHQLFDILADSILGFVDVLAERATALGGVACGTVRMAAAGSPVAEMPQNIRDGRAFVVALAERYGSLAKYTREAIEKADDADDEETVDIFVEIGRTLDKDLYFLEAHLQS
jgi:starvation-inducible DNA-binding protein